jgi:hypothetical protein
MEPNNRKPSENRFQVLAENNKPTQQRGKPRMKNIYEGNGYFKSNIDLASRIGRVWIS